MYKAIFLDLDGTLLDDQKNISDENKEAIKYAKANGALVCIASGRPICATKNFWKIANPSKYIIYSNGAGIYDCDKNESLFTVGIEKEICICLYNYSIQNEICIRFDTPYGRFVNDEKYILNSDALFHEDGIQIISDNDILQISFICEDKEKIRNAFKYVNENIKSNIKVEDMFVTGTENNFFAISIVNSSVSKGNAIYGLCKYLKIDIKDAIAIGDGINDISMIKMVGFGVAMGNATVELKQNAKEVTSTNNENGVAKILKSKF